MATYRANGLARGQQVYESICITCHGSPEKEGTLPTSRPFWKEPFKNGNDPLSLYKTITHGFGQMPAFAVLSPIERYDAVHYVREAFVRPLGAVNFAIGISLLGVLYLGAGGMLGSAIYEVARGRGGELLQEPALFWLTVFANAIGGLPWLWMMWRARGTERSINFRDERMGFKSVCAAMWIAGFAVSLAFAVPR